MSWCGGGEISEMPSTARHTRDHWRDFVCRQLPAFPGLGTLGHLDFKLLCTHQVFRRYAEPRRSNLLDLILRGIAIFEFDEVNIRVFSALTGVRSCADTVHGDGQRVLRLGTQDSDQHGLSCESLPDSLNRFDKLNGYQLARPEQEK